jgi:hypothetical protein
MQAINGKKDNIISVTNLKPYVVILTAKPAVRLPKNFGKIELNFTDPEGPRRLLIAKIEEESGGTIIQTGLSFRVFLDAENVKDAVNLAKSFADGIVSFITVLTGRGLEIPREEIAYEITPDVTKREFLQVFYDVPFKSPSRRQVDPQKLIDFMDKQFKPAKKYSERIGRAIRWYRLGAMVTDIFDQFNCFWIGLEALNPLLQEKLSVKGDLTVSGIKAFIQDKMKRKELYKNIHQLRIGIMHSTKKLGELRELVATHIPDTGEVLFKAICFLLEFEDWETMTHGKILREFPMRGELQGYLIGGTPTSLGPDGQDPHFELIHNIKKIKSEESGAITTTFETSFKTCINKGIQFQQTELRFYGDSETSGEILNTTLHKAGEQNSAPKVSENKSLDYEIIDVVSGKETWSMYQLTDRTKLKVRIVLIKALRQKYFHQNGNPHYDLNTQTIIGVIPAKSSLRTPSPHSSHEETQSAITNQEINFETLQEPWNKYTLSDGTQIQIKTTLTKVYKTSEYDQYGVPIYVVNWVMNAKINVPVKLKKKGI